MEVPLQNSHFFCVDLYLTPWYFLKCLNLTPYSSTVFAGFVPHLWLSERKCATLRLTFLFSGCLRGIEPCSWTILMWPWVFTEHQLQNLKSQTCFFLYTGGGPKFMLPKLPDVELKCVTFPRIYSSMAWKMLGIFSQIWRKRRIASCI